MKNKTEQSLKLLESALRALPATHSLANARSYMSNAITEIIKADKKVQRKEKTDDLTPAQKWELDLKTSTLVNPMTERLKTDVLAKIDSLISTEQNKIDRIQVKDTKQTDLDTLLD